jgi:hypothetical protein
MLSSLLSALPTFARASTIYTYTGPNFSPSFGSTGTALPYSTSDHVQGSFTLSSPLAVGTFTLPTPSSFSFTDGIFTFTDKTDPGAEFTFYTDAMGNITFAVFYFDEVANGFHADLSVHFGNGNLSAMSDNDQVGGVGYADGYAYGVGVLSSQSTADPASTPEPSSLILLGTGCLATIGALRRRTQS